MLMAKASATKATSASSASASAHSGAQGALTICDSLAAPAIGVLVEKKSEFTGVAIHCDSAEELRAFVDAVRADYPQSRHVAFAAVFSTGKSVSERMSDDGEPVGTAGKPILSLLRQRGLTNVAVAVARHFGGILLGAGGLVRAYSSAASLALGRAKAARMVPFAIFSARVEYAQLASLEILARACDGDVIKKDFDDRVSIEIVVPCSRRTDLARAVRDSFNGRLVLHLDRAVAKAQPL